MSQKKPIQITIFTGFLGVGKTSIILSLLSKLPEDYKVALLKNEFGDIEVDSKLARQSNLATVSEILNGCMCCTLVGQMKLALLELRDKYHPSRIIIESSGSAFPATLAFQIRELEQETGGDFKLDAIVTVVDAENFIGYEDTSPTAKMQATYTDMILINKWELVSERDLDLVFDHLNTLNDGTPKLKCQGQKGVDPALIFGLESQLFRSPVGEELANHHEEVETVTIFRNQPPTHPSLHNAGEACSCEPLDDVREVATGNDRILLHETQLKQALSHLPKDSVWRVKGFVTLQPQNQAYILNWAFGRYDLVLNMNKPGELDELALTVMGAQGEVKRYARGLAHLLHAKVV